jgi:hypothetical protein
MAEPLRTMCGRLLLGTLIYLEGSTSNGAGVTARSMPLRFRTSMELSDAEVGRS